MATLLDEQLIAELEAGIAEDEKALAVAVKECDRLKAINADLLEALEVVTEGLQANHAQIGNPDNADGWDDRENFDDYQQARAAIAKATGDAT